MTIKCSQSVILLFIEILIKLINKIKYINIAYFITYVILLKRQMETENGGYRMSSVKRVYVEKNRNLQSGQKNCSLKSEVILESVA